MGEKSKADNSVNGIQKIALVGPESTGKSWLAKQLALHFGEPWVPEFARYLIPHYSSAYLFDEVTIMSRAQQAAEDFGVSQAKRLLFVDTTQLTFAIWQQHSFQQVAPFVTQHLDYTGYALHLLTYPDLPWEPDPLRGFPDFETRLYFFEWHERLLKEAGVDYAIIKGVGEERLQSALKALAAAGLG